MIPTNIKPLLDRVLIERIEQEEEVTQAGIILTQKLRNKPTILARVLAVGEGRMLSNGTIIPLTIEPDDVVLIHADTPWLEENLTIINEENILGYVE